MNKSQMLHSVRNYLSQFGKPDEKILKTIKEADRKNFMEENKSFAYLDQAISIGHGQTISQPSTVARMISLLNLKKTDEVLEIGTGSAWNAVLLGKLSKKVLTLEIVPELAERAKDKLKKLGIKNVEIKQKDFRDLEQKFNKIIFTAGIEFCDDKSASKASVVGREGRVNKIQQEKIIEDFAEKNLKENGVLICPYREGPLIILKNKENKIKKEYSKENYVFVPLILE